MRITAVIAEYNPFHNGHKYLIDYAKQTCADAVVAVMSGNWVQRGDTAVISKFSRAKQALSCGVDLVAELPTFWAMATAQKFAQGALQIIANLNADTLIFGSECGDTSRIIETAYCVKSEEFSKRMRKLLDSGITPAKARETAVEELCSNGELLRSPNDTLAVEYVCAAKELNLKIKFNAIKRIGVEHDSNNTNQNYCSASKIREMILNGNIASAEQFVPQKSYEILLNEFNNGKISDIKLLEKTIITNLRIMSKDKYKSLPDISEGIENRLYNAARMSSTLTQLMEYTSTKRYTNARLRRLILSAFLKQKESEIPKVVPYIRVLGCSELGKEILQNARNTSKTPIIMRSTDLKGNPCFDFEAKATEIYALSQNQPDDCGGEYTNGIIKC